MSDATHNPVDSASINGDQLFSEIPLGQRTVSRAKELGQAPESPVSVTARPPASPQAPASLPSLNASDIPRLDAVTHAVDKQDNGNETFASNGDGDRPDDDRADDDEDDEPRLKYARLTPHVAAVYRNGDSTSAFTVAGEKMIVGTHEGYIHLLQVPTFKSLRTYRAHSASVTSVSVSPLPSSIVVIQPQAYLEPQTSRVLSSSNEDLSPAATARRPRGAYVPVTNVGSNNLYIATSSLDGYVCVQSLMDPEDVHMRNFARPVQAVALSPNYKTDNTYLSGGLAGNLILTVGASPGRTSTSIGSTAAAASGWLGSFGISSSAGKDVSLHRGEGTISTIKWSLSGKFVVWLNELGIKVMRSKLHLDSNNQEDAWIRIGHVDRPQSDEWDTMGAVWKGRAEWIDDQSAETDDSEMGRPVVNPPTSANIRQLAATNEDKAEKLMVGWGGTLWIIHVFPTAPARERRAGDRAPPGRAEIIKILRMDCIIAGISLYTQNLLLILAFCLPEDEDSSDASSHDPENNGHVSTKLTDSGAGRPSAKARRRENCQPPELRLIDLVSQAEIMRDGLNVSRYERLSSADYHLGVLNTQVSVAPTSQRGALGALVGFGSDVLSAAINPKNIFSSNASVMSRNSGDDRASASKPGSVKSKLGSQVLPKQSLSVHPNLAKPGLKIFIHSPYDCILANKRDLADHLNWLLERHSNQAAWELLNDNPEILPDPLELDNIPSNPKQPPLTPKQAKTALTGPGADASSSTAGSAIKSLFSTVEVEKRRIGELWIRQLVDSGDWVEAGSVCGRILNTADTWEKWGWIFAGSKRFDEIVNYLPMETMRPPIPQTLYEIVLAHYIQTDLARFKALLERWPTDLFGVDTVASTLENQLTYREVREGSIDWYIVVGSLARLYESSGRYRDALKCFVKVHDADSAFRIIRDNHLAAAVCDDIPSFIELRLPPEGAGSMTARELDEATAEAIGLLVDEARHGLVQPKEVVTQLLARNLNLYIFLYLRGLWKGEDAEDQPTENKERLVADSRDLVGDFADLAVRLFALYDRSLLMELLKTSACFTFDKAVDECEAYNYDDELVYLYSKTGQMKRALFLIIDRLHDVPKAIAFAKEQGDPDLWDDLLNYSMDKPRFIRGLLEHVGTAINPVALVRRIPEGLEIEGLRDGIRNIVKEHELHYSISSGAARVVRSEVSSAQAELRRGQRHGVKFQILDDAARAPGDDTKRDSVSKSETKMGVTSSSAAAPLDSSARALQGLCATCTTRLGINGDQTLVGFACGHVFHLPHLLDQLSASSSSTPQGRHTLRRDALDDLLRVPRVPESRTGRGHLIGTKVTHARLLKDSLRGGCPICMHLTHSAEST